MVSSRKWSTQALGHGTSSRCSASVLPLDAPLLKLKTVRAEMVVMLTWSIFERRFAADPSVVRRQIHLDGKPYMVVGVLPGWFSYPDATVQVWVPYASVASPEELRYHDHHQSRVLAR